MTFLEKLNMIERVDQLIRLKATGTADSMANRLGVSRSTVFELLGCMKLMGAEIKYCKHRKSYYYSTEKVLSIGFMNLDQVRGGKKMTENIESPIFSDFQYLCLYKNHDSKDII